MSDGDLTVMEPGTRDLTAPKPPGALLFAPKDLSEAMALAKILASSNFIPKAFQGKPNDVLVVMWQAQELSIPLFQALKFTAVINNRPSIWGDLVVALVKKSGKCEHIVTSWDEATKTATARVKRVGQPEAVSTFSMADAKRAGLDQKDTYKGYPQRMCKWRALSWALRDEFPDVLAGMDIAEESMDLPMVASVQPIGQPRQLVQITEEFLAPPPQEKRKPEAPESADQAGPDEPQTVTIEAAMLAQEGKTEKGKPWTRYRIVLAGGRELTTFSSSVFSDAQLAASMKDPVIITTKPGKGAGNVILLTVAPAPADQAEGGEGG